MSQSKAYRLGETAKQWHTASQLIDTAKQLFRLHGREVATAYLRGAGLAR